MSERGLAVDHVTVFRWVQRHAPEINKRMRPHLKMSGTSYRLDIIRRKILGSNYKVRCAGNGRRKCSGRNLNRGSKLSSALN